LDDIEEIIETWQALCLLKGPEEARHRVCKLYGDEEGVQAIELERSRSKERFITLRDPTVLDGRLDFETDYPGPDFHGAHRWRNYKQLLKENGFGEDAVATIDGDSTSIVARLPHPLGRDEFQTRGLVVGHVQSGKTANYTAVISKAADWGYRLFIVLSGMTSSLRRQTQGRLKRELEGDWYWLTDETHDFAGAVRSASHDLNPGSRETRILMVVKKNTHILSRLKRYLRDADRDVLKACPVLVIDDEADQASVNTAEAAERRTAINRHIVEIMQSLPKVAYAGYTATPFANVFIDPRFPEDLYPRDFIVGLRTSPEYFGAERIFGRQRLEGEEDEPESDGMDIVRKIDEFHEVDALIPASRDERFDFQPSMTRSLRKALLYFLMATASRYARGQQEHSSMLVHTTFYVDVHDKLKDLLACDLLTKIVPAISASNSELMDTMRVLWELEEMDRQTRECAGAPEPVSFEELVPHLALVCERLEVVVDNGSVGNGLEYPDLDEGHSPCVYVAIGGNTLSRGLTLEGLVVSYFIRRAGAYDTLLQMGRWFGYRRGYEDLPRAWMTETQQLEFEFLATVEAEIREDIRQYRQENLTPTDFAIRVQSHRRLSPTSKAKMKNCMIASASFSNALEQTTRFEADNKVWLDENLNAANELMKAARVSGELESPRSGCWLIRGVPVANVLGFLERYQLISQRSGLSFSLLKKYIQTENRAGALKHWNVGIVGLPKGRNTRPLKEPDGAPGPQPEALGSVDLGVEEPVWCINRSRYTENTPTYIKGMASLSDRFLDLTVPGGSTRNKDLAVALRNNQQPGVGLLLLYPISRFSVPERPDSKTGFRPERRGSLKAEEHVVGLGLAFPKSEVDQKDYVQNNLGVLYVEGAGRDEEFADEEVLAKAEGGEEDNEELWG